MWKKRWKGAGERERKPVGRQWSVGTISADACSYAVRVLLSRAEIPAGFLRSLSSRAAFAERWNGGRQRCRKKETRWEKGGRGWGGGGWGEKGGEKKRMRSEPNQSSSGHGPPTTFTRRRNYEVVQLGNQLAIFRESTSTAARIV